MEKDQGPKSARELRTKPGAQTTVCKTTVRPVSFEKKSDLYRRNLARDGGLSTYEVVGSLDEELAGQEAMAAKDFAHPRIRQQRRQLRVTLPVQYELRYHPFVHP